MPRQPSSVGIRSVVVANSRLDSSVVLIVLEIGIDSAKDSCVPTLQRTGRTIPARAGRRAQSLLYELFGGSRTAFNTFVDRLGF